MGTSGTYTHIKTVWGDITSYLDNGLIEGAQYYYRIRAYNSAGNSGYSNEANATTLFSPPTILSFNPQSGPIGTTVIITGTHFNTIAANNVVYFGAVKATINNASSTSLSVTVPVGSTYQPISVTNLTTKLTAYSTKPFIVTFTGGVSFSTSSFAPKVDFTTANRPMHIVLGDIDGDGKSDIITTNLAGGSLSVFRNTSTSGSITVNSLHKERFCDYE